MIEQEKFVKLSSDMEHLQHSTAIREEELKCELVQTLKLRETDRSTTTTTTVLASSL